MERSPEKLEQRLEERRQENALRTPHLSSRKVDFSSNDYLGLAGDQKLYRQACELVMKYGPPYNGSTGSRLLTGHHILAEEVEADICAFHEAPSSLLFTSGYSANIGLLSGIPQKGDIICYDQFSHASIREGIRLSLAAGIKYRHLDLQDLERKLKRYRKQSTGACYIVTESVFSMDGDSPDLIALVTLAEKYGAYLIVDEAHALGVVGSAGQGMVAGVGLQDRIFATVMAFGKAAGTQGAAILGSRELRSGLLNFSRSQIYTTALSPHTLATIKMSYAHFGSEQHSEQLKQLRSNIDRFQKALTDPELKEILLPDGSHIQACILAGNQTVKAVAKRLDESGFDVRPILSPTVQRGRERLRICLHAYNQEQEIDKLFTELKHSIRHARKAAGVYHDSRL